MESGQSCYWLDELRCCDLYIEMGSLT